MSVFRAAFIAHLDADSAVAALIPDGVFANIVPQNEPVPFAVCGRIGRQRRNDTSGPTPTVDEIWQVNAWGKDDDEAEELAEAIETAGLTSGQEDWSDYTVHKVNHGGTTDVESDPADRETVLVGKAIVFEIHRDVTATP